MALWWDGVGTVDTGAELLATLGRLTGLLGAFVALLALLLIGLGRLARHHALLGRLCLGLLLAHAVLITAGYTVGDGITLWAELGRLVSGYPGVITAIAGLALLVVVAVTSARAARRRLRYETWYFIHLYSYLGVALAFSHQIAAGRRSSAGPVARAYWIALYVVTLGALVVAAARRAARPQPLPRAARRAGRRGRARRDVDRDRRPAAGAAPRALRPVLHVALPHARPLVGGPPVLALGRARRPPAADHGEGRRRLHRGAAPARSPARAWSPRARSAASRPRRGGAGACC